MEWQSWLSLEGARAAWTSVWGMGRDGRLSTKRTGQVGRGGEWRGEQFEAQGTQT